MRRIRVDNDRYLTLKKINNSYDFENYQLTISGKDDLALENGSLFLSSGSEFFTSLQKAFKKANLEVIFNLLKDQAQDSAAATIIANHIASAIGMPLLPKCQYHFDPKFEWSDKSISDKAKPWQSAEKSSFFQSRVTGHSENGVSPTSKNNIKHKHPLIFWKNNHSPSKKNEENSLLSSVAKNKTWS